MRLLYWVLSEEEGKKEKAEEMSKKLDQEILEDDHPEILQLLRDSWDASAKCLSLEKVGKTEEAIKMWRIHEDLFNQYMFASKLVLTNHEDLDHDFYGDLYR